MISFACSRSSLAWPSWFAIIDASPHLAQRLTVKIKESVRKDRPARPGEIHLVASGGIVRDERKQAGEDGVGPREVLLRPAAEREVVADRGAVLTESDRGRSGRGVGGRRCSVPLPVSWTPAGDVTVWLPRRSSILEPLGDRVS